MSDISQTTRSAGAHRLTMASFPRDWTMTWDELFTQATRFEVDLEMVLETVERYRESDGETA